MENFVTPNGYAVKETWDCDSCQSSLDIYEDGEDKNFVGTLYGKSLCDYKDEDGNVDGEELDNDILDEIDS